MKNLKRNIAFLLSAILLVTVFASCNGSEGKNSKLSALKRGEPGEFVVPEGACEGEEFSIYLAYPAGKEIFMIEEENGEEINDVLYQRNERVEEYLGVTLNFGATKLTDNGNDQAAEADLIRLLIMSGDTTYDAFLHCQHRTHQLMQEKLLVDWNTIPYVNVKSPWWYSNVERDITFGGKIYEMTGDYNLNSFSKTACLIFNKTMCDELDLEYPYEMVLDGTWTHDKFVKYVQAATKDINGDGRLKYDDDRYGYGCWAWEGIPSFYVSYGAETVVKDDNNMPILNLDNEHTYSVIDNMLDIFKLPGAFWERGTYGLDDDMFNEGRLLFNDSFISDIPYTRSLENIDVGFIPYPKYDEYQTEYHSRTSYISEFTLIPITNTDLEKTGAVLETMAYFSHKLVMPAYFDTLVMIKSTRDVESEEMIPIIREFARYDDGVMEFYGGYYIITADRGNTLSSYIATNKGGWDEKLNELIDIYSDDEPVEETAAE